MQKECAGSRKIVAALRRQSGAAIEDQIDLEDARKALADAKKNGTVSWEALKRKLDL